MRALRRIGCLAITLVLFGSTPASAAITNNTIGPRATLSAHGHLARGAVILQCTEGWVDMTLTIRQDGAVASGRGAAVCSGTRKAHLVRTRVKGEQVLVEGPAEACASAVNTFRGRVVDQRRWCRAGRITLTQ